MKILCKRLLILIALSILMVPNAMAFPIAMDDMVLMNADFDETYPHSPYTMTKNYDSANSLVLTTFCLEMDETFYNNGTYKVDSVEDYATDGGGGAVDGKDEVSNQSKWLYAYFMTNQSSVNANQVQKAIWYLEDENDSYSYIWQDSFLTAYNDDDDRDQFFGWDIMAVNLISDNNPDVQSQLVGVAPVPEPATILLLGVGLMGMAGFGRKKLKG